MADNENTFITRDDLNKFGKLDYHDVINDNRRSNARANAWGEQNANAPAQVNALKGTYQTAFAEHMTKTDGFMRNKVGRGDSDLMTNIKIALNEVNHKLCTPLDAGNMDNLQQSMQELAAGYDTLITACQTYIQDKDRFYRRKRGLARIGLVRSILDMAVKERGEFSDISVINYFNSNPTEGFVLGNLLGYRTTFEGTKTKEALEQEKAENKTGNFIYDLNDTPGVLNEHAKNKAAASRLFSVLGISNLCTNSRITAVKDANGKLTFGTKSEKLHSQTFESGSNVALYSELKEKIKNDADGTNGDIRFSAEAMSDLSTIKLMNALMGGMGTDFKQDVSLRYQRVNLDGWVTYIVTGAYLLRTDQLFNKKVTSRNLKDLAGRNPLFSDIKYKRIPPKVLQGLKDFADNASKDITGNFINFYFGDVLDAERRENLKSILARLGNDLKKHEDANKNRPKPNQYRLIPTKESFERHGGRSFVADLFGDEHCKAEWDIDIDGNAIPTETELYFSTYRTLNNNLHKMKEDQGDHFVKYLADTAALYMNSRTENANVLNDAPELSADMKAVKRLTATNLDQETLQRALRLYGNEAAEFNLEYGQKLQAVKETVLTPEFKELMKANNITDEGVMYENLALCLTVKSLPEKFNSLSNLNSLLQFAKSQRNQKFKQICDDYLKTDAETAGKINGFAQMEVKLTQLRRIQDIDKMFKGIDLQNTIGIIDKLAGDEHPDMFSHKKEDLSIDWETLKIDERLFIPGKNKKLLQEEEERKRRQEEQKRNAQAQHNRSKVISKLLENNLNTPLDIDEPEELQYDQKAITELSLEEALNTCHKTAEERVDFYTAQFEKYIKAEKNESLDKNEPEYIIEVPDKKIKKCGGEPVEKPLFGEDGKIDLSTVREDRAGADCYIIAVLQSLARYNPDYITKHLIKDDPKDPKWAIVTLFDEMGRKQKIRVQKTPILKGGIDPDERALWVQCVTKAAVVLIGKDVTNRFGDYVHYRHHDEKEKGGHDYEHHKIKDKSLDLRGLEWGSEEIASELIFGKRRLETLETRSKNPEDYQTRTIEVDGKEYRGNFSKTLIDRQGDIALAKALAYFKMGYTITCNTAEGESSVGFYNKSTDKAKFPINVTKRHEFVFCGEGKPKNGQRTVRFQSAYESEIEECTFGEFKQCFTGIHIMPNK